MRQVALSERLRTVAGMVTRGNRVCDVGCDHGFVPIYLVQQGISPGVLAMDLREGPLRAARGHVSAYGLEGQIETRLSDGLHNYKAGEADTLICAGMGGGLMMRILEAERDKTDSFQEMILQPQSEIEKFRGFLRESGYRILDEEMIAEDGKFYQVIRAAGKDSLSMMTDCGGVCGTETGCRTGRCGSGEPGGAAEENRTVCRRTEGPFGAAENIGVSCLELCKLENRYGPILLQKRAPVFLSYLEREAAVYEEILANLRRQGLAEEKRKIRYEQVETLLADNRLAGSVTRAAK